MNGFDVELLKIIPMASGHLCLNLTENVSWEKFPCYAEKLLKYLNGNIVSKIDAVDVRIWNININNVGFRLTYDDWPIMVSIESSGSESDSIIESIKDSLYREKLKGDCSF